MPKVIHANWSNGALHLWAEDALLSAQAQGGAGTAPGMHPFANADLGPQAMAIVGATERGKLRMRLPGVAGRPLPSTTLEWLLGGTLSAEEETEEPPAEWPVEEPAQTATATVELTTVEIETALVPREHAAGVLLALSEELARERDLDGESEQRPQAGDTLEYWALGARLANHLLAQQRFIPTLVQTVGGELKGAWRLWVSDEVNAGKVRALVESMPAAARACDDSLRHRAWEVTEDFLAAVADAACRQTLVREDFAQAVADRDAAADAHVAWLQGLLGRGEQVGLPAGLRQDLVKRVRGWISGLEERGASSAWRLLLRLNEPAPEVPRAGAPPSDDATWGISFHLQSIDLPSLVVDAPDVWLLTGDSVTIMGRRVDHPQDLLLKELGRASRFYKPVEAALRVSEPAAIEVGTRKAYEFLREVRPVLLEQGFGVEAPAWWDTPSARLGAKLRLEGDPALGPGGGLTNASKAQVGLASLINYTWEIAVGDFVLSLKEFEQLAARRMPLVRVNGRWVEIRPEDVQAAIKFIRENPGGTIRLGEALRLAYGSELRQTGIPVVGLEATGWLQGFLNSESAAQQLETLPPPKLFQGTLRPYQARGVSWMMFQERLGFGICLADDMGLGKTIQLLALMAYEREEPAEETQRRRDEETKQEESAESDTRQATGDEEKTREISLDGSPPSHPPAVSSSQSIAPTLLLVPMSVVGNWQHETRRFCPHLKVLTHHGAERLQGDEFVEKALKSDLIVTTYSLAHRDRELLGRLKWGRVVLDEAQYIKNPSAKQSQAVRGFEAERRVALTGTPVENRLTELWSIMDFLNPGYLGSSGSFRTRFAVPVERYHDRHKSEQLRGLIRPFVLRRLKSDPTVVADLPAKVESKEFSHLTAEQAGLYENCVKRMLTEVDHADGIQRRGLVLSALIRLKQICNHPSQVLKDQDESGLRPPEPTRSGKCIRLLEMLDEVLAEGDQALVFTQFRQMGRMLELMIRHKFGREVLFIHGGVTQPQRQRMIEQFQKGDGAHPVLLLSLRAGGVGLNLTAATHVFHFDRWWNPAVENQATDRAYRIGQTRTVQVHKFVVRGTLEERIDQMIESKTALADNIIGSGEQWLSELNTDQLRDILTLRNDAIDDVDV